MKVGIKIGFLSSTLALGLVAPSLVGPAGALAGALTTSYGPTNQLANPSFEDAASTTGPAGWTPSGTTAWESGTAHTGSRSVSITGGGSSWTSAPVPSGPAGAYRLVSAWILIPGQGSSTTTTTSDIAVNFLNASGGVVIKDSTGNVNSNCNSSYYSWGGQWCYQMRVYPVPDGAVAASVTLETGQQGTEKWFYDDVFFGQVTSSSDSYGPAEHRPAVPPAPGTATVSVDANQVVRTLPTTLAGDNAEYRGDLPNIYNDPAMTKIIRDVSHPGILRFPGGNFTPVYDWEHPGDGNTGSASTDIDQLMEYVRATNTADVLWSLNFSGVSNTFTVSYTGNATSALLSVTSNDLSVHLSGQTDGTQDLEVQFAQHPTVGNVVDTVGAMHGYGAAMVSGETDRRRDPVADELITQTNTAVNSTGTTVQVNEGNIHKVLRLDDYANNPNSTVIGPNGLTRNQWEAAHGQVVGPYNIRYFEVGNETYLYGATDVETSGTPETPLDPPHNAEKVAQFAQALHQQDPGVHVGLPNVSVIGGGCCGSGGAQYRFNQVVDSIAGPYVDFVIDHPYEQFHATYDGELEWPQHMQRLHITRFQQDTFAEYSPDHRTNIPVFFSEFNLMPYTFASPVPATNQIYQFVNGLAEADLIGAMMTDGASELSHWDQLDNPYGSHVVYATGPNQMAVEAAGYALGMYNDHFGSVLVQDQYASPTYDNPSADATRASIDPGGSGLKYPWQTSYSSLSSDGSHMYVMLINKSGTDPLVPSDQDLPLATTIKLNGFAPAPIADVWTLNGTGRNAFNVTESHSPAQFIPGAYGMTHSTISNANSTFLFTTPAHSVTVIELTGTLKATKLAYTGSVTATATETTTLAAQLESASVSAPIPGQNVNFAFQGNNYSAITDSQGVASVAVPVSGPAGSYVTSATFAPQSGSAYYPSSASASVAVAREPTTTSYTGQTTVRGNSFQAAAHLQDRLGRPVRGKTIHFSTGSASATVVTDASGNASATLAWQPSAMSTTISATYDGDGTYLGSNTYATVIRPDGG